MAVTVPLNTGKARTGGAASLAVSFASLPAAGDAIIVVVTAARAGAVTLANGNVTDNQGGSYVLDASSGQYNYGGVYYGNVGVWSRQNIGAPSGTFTITFTASAGTPGITMGAIAVRSAATSGALDKTKTATGSSTAPATGDSDATTQADEIVVAGFGEINTTGSTQTVTDPSGYTVIFNEGEAASYIVSGGAYKILTATGAQSASWSVTGAAAPWGAILATYKGAAAVTSILRQMMAHHGG